VIPDAGSRWKRLLWCLVAAVAWQCLWSIAVDPDGKTTLYLATAAPSWLQRLHAWRPYAVSVRILSFFGIRCDVDHYSGNTGVILASLALEAVILTGLFYALVSWARSRGRRHDEPAAA
jgi:hypothetical protein